MTSAATSRPAPARAVADVAATPASVAGSAARSEPIPSAALFAGAREVQIAHGGAVYRLKQTALGKLILTK